MLELIVIVAYIGGLFYFKEAQNSDSVFEHIFFPFHFLKRGAEIIISLFRGGDK